MSESPGISLEFSATTAWMEIFLADLVGDPSVAPSTKIAWRALAYQLATAPSLAWHVELKATPSPSSS